MSASTNYKIRRLDNRPLLTVESIIIATSSSSHRPESSSSCSWLGLPESAAAGIKPPPSRVLDSLKWWRSCSIPVRLLPTHPWSFVQVGACRGCLLRCSKKPPSARPALRHHHGRSPAASATLRCSPGSEVRTLRTGLTTTTVSVPIIGGTIR